MAIDMYLLDCVLGLTTYMTGLAFMYYSAVVLH